MNKFLVFLFCFFSSFLTSAQSIKVNSIDSHKAFVKTLNNSKDDRFNAILNQYDAYIKINPNDVTVKVYRCKFIGSAYIDEYEEYNLKYEETEACINSLVENHPDNSKVLLYQLENTYGEDREPLLKAAIKSYHDKSISWDFDDVSSVFEIGANFYTEDEDFRAIEYADFAEKYNDTLDLSVLKANAYLRLDNKEKARACILENLNVEHPNWVLNEKGTLLITLDEDAEALKLFERIKAKDSTYSNNESLYQIFIKKENFNQARTYLVNDTIPSWNKANSLQKLAKHDLKYSEPEVALRSLRRMHEESYYDDFFGIKRLKLAFKAPTYLWTIGEILHLFTLVLFVLFLLCIPYLWLLPIYSISKYFNFKKVKETIKLPVDWSLRHFWLISFLYIFTQFTLILIFNYQVELNYYFDIVGYSSDDYEETDLISANAQLIFSGLLLVFTLILLNLKRLRFVFRTNNSVRETIGLSILFLIFNGFVLRILGSFVDITEGAEYISAFSAKEEIVALLNEYGFYITVIAVAVIVPFYEEIIFRGIILTSTEKHLGFKVANVIQASFFALIHFNLSLFLFYLVFGIVTGYFVKRSGGLLTGITFHAVNNFVVTVSLFYAN